jgi:hypothetical protein
MRKSIEPSQFLERVAHCFERVAAARCARAWRAEEPSRLTRRRRAV